MLQLHKRKIEIDLPGAPSMELVAAVAEPASPSSHCRVPALLHSTCGRVLHLLPPPAPLAYGRSRGSSCLRTRRSPPSARARGGDGEAGKIEEVRRRREDFGVRGYCRLAAARVDLRMLNGGEEYAATRVCVSVIGVVGLNMDGQKTLGHLG